MIKRLWLVLLLNIAFAANAAPIIYNAPVSANPSDIISINGSGFNGGAPTVNFTGTVHAGTTAGTVIRADDKLIQVQVPPGLSFDVWSVAVVEVTGTSNAILINAPAVWTFDTPEVGAGNVFRIFGRNLFITPTAPSATFVDLSTLTTYAATVNTSLSDPFYLTVTTPAGITSGHTYKVTISNGYSSTDSNATDAAMILNGRAAAGSDFYSLGLPWGADFVTADGPGYNGTVDNNNHHLYNVMTDPFVSPHAVGDGVTDDTTAIQAAINQCTRYGGIVQFPAGTYRISAGLGPVGNGLTLKSGCVLQGHTASDTTLNYGPASTPAGGYSLTVFFVGTGTSKVGMADLTLTNVDAGTGDVITAAQVQGPNTNKVFLKRTVWNEGQGRYLFFNSPSGTADRVAIENSTFNGVVNSQGPNLNFTGNIGLGPLYIWQVSNLAMNNNTISWFDGQNSFKDITNAVIENNSYTRHADQVIATSTTPAWLNIQSGQQALYPLGSVLNRSFGRQFAIGEAKGTVIQNNTYQVDMSTGLDVKMEHNWFDGETIVNEGEGSGRADKGTATSATSTTLVDAVHGTWGETSAVYKYISILSGAGRGQWRHATRSGNTITVTPAWDVIPSAGDYYTIFQPAYENVIIRTNTISGNPAGIMLYARYYLNTIVSGNNVTDNGGIFARGDQRTSFLSAIRNIEFVNNTLTDTNGWFPSYVGGLFAAVNGTSIFGSVIDSVQVRGNNIIAKTGTPSYLFNEGYFNYMTPPAPPFVPTGAGTQGTVFQGNTCNSSCNPDYLLSTGVNETVIWSPTPNPPRVLTDTIVPVVVQPVLCGAPIGSTGTAVGP